MQGNDDEGLTTPAASDEVRASSAGEAGRLPPDVPVLDSSELFGHHKQIVIGHNDCRYVLRITKHGKLILNK
jgi:hemin uptake protein HemP